MYQSIRDFVVAVGNKPISGSSVRSTLDSTLTAISADVLPALKAISKSDELFKSERARILVRIAGSLELRKPTAEGLVAELVSFFKDVVAEGNALIDMIDSSVNDKVFLTMSNAKELAIIKTVNDLSSITLYTIDLMYYVASTEDTNMPKVRNQQVVDGVPSYRTMLRAYIRDFDKRVKDMSKVSTNRIDMDAGVSMMDRLLAKQGKLLDFPLVDGFINNPIYHIRMYFVDRDVKKYEVLKEKKVLLEHKLLDLKLRAAGKHDDRLAGQIEYYEDKVSGIEYELADQ